MTTRHRTTPQIPAWPVAFLLVFLLGVASFVGHAAVTVHSPDWNQYDPEAPFLVHQYYWHPYTDVVYIAGRTWLSDGTEWLIVERVRGTVCQRQRGCLWPAETVRGVWLPVTVTVSPPPAAQ